MSLLYEDASYLSGKTIEELYYIQQFLNNVITHIQTEMKDFNNRISFLERVLYSKDNDLKMVLKEIKYREDIMDKNNKLNHEDDDVSDVVSDVVSDDDVNDNEPYFNKVGYMASNEEMAIDDFIWK